MSGVSAPPQMPTKGIKRPPEADPPTPEPKRQRVTAAEVKASPPPQPTSPTKSIFSPVKAEFPEKPTQPPAPAPAPAAVRPNLAPSPLSVQTPPPAHTLAMLQAKAKEINSRTAAANEQINQAQMAGDYEKVKHLRSQLEGLQAMMIATRTQYGQFMESQRSNAPPQAQNGTLSQPSNPLSTPSMSTPGMFTPSPDPSTLKPLGHQRTSGGQIPGGHTRTPSIPGVNPAFKIENTPNQLPPQPAAMQPNVPNDVATQMHKMIAQKRRQSGGQLEPPTFGALSQQPQPQPSHPQPPPSPFTLPAQPSSPANRASLPVVWNGLLTMHVTNQIGASSELSCYVNGVSSNSQQ